jgi:hypothetical protein
VTAGVYIQYVFEGRFGITAAAGNQFFVLYQKYLAYYMAIKLAKVLAECYTQQSLVGKDRVGKVYVGHSPKIFTVFFSRHSEKKKKTSIRSAIVDGEISLPCDFRGTWQSSCPHVAKPPSTEYQTCSRRHRGSFHPVPPCDVEPFKPCSYRVT